MRLSDLYDADCRTKNATARRMASEGLIPHPLNNVQYADAISACRHAGRHAHGQLCRQRVMLPDGTLAPERDDAASEDPLPAGDELRRRVDDRVYRRGESARALETSHTDS